MSRETRTPNAVKDAIARRVSMIARCTNPAGYCKSCDAAVAALMADVEDLLAQIQVAEDRIARVQEVIEEFEYSACALTPKESATMLKAALHAGQGEPTKESSR